MKARIVLLTHHEAFLQAIQHSAYITVVQQGEYVGSGVIIDFDCSIVALMDNADGAIFYFSRTACRFYRLLEPA